MGTEARTWQDLLSSVAADTRALPASVHELLATCADARTRRAWAARRDLPAQLLHDRASVERDARTLARLVAQPTLARDVARAACERDGSRHTGLAYALRRDCPDREGAGRVADATAGAAGLRALEVVATRVGPLPTGRKRTRAALLEVLGRCSSGRDLVVLPQADSAAELERAVEAVTRPLPNDRAVERYLVQAALPDPAGIIDRLQCTVGYQTDSTLQRWARLVAPGCDGDRPERFVTAVVTRRLARYARTAAVRARTFEAAPGGEVAAALLANPLVTGAERTRLVGTLPSGVLAAAVASPAVLTAADDLDGLRAAARRNGTPPPALWTVGDVDASPAARILEPAWIRTRPYEGRVPDAVSFVCRLSQLGPTERETVLALLGDWDGTVGELVRIAAALAA